MNTVDISVTCETETEKAILVMFDEGPRMGETVWVPKSVIDEESEVQGTGDEGLLCIAEWFAEKEGLE